MSRDNRDETAPIAPGQPTLNNGLRKALLHHIHAHPGATIRELRRATGASASGVNHHLDILMQTGFVSEQSHGRSRRFLPIAMQAPMTRMGAILLREPSLASLHELISQNPWLAQGDFMDLAAREFGWSRSTTQHRLGRLVKGGLVKVRKQGRFKLHAIEEATASFRPVRMPK